MAALRPEPEEPEVFFFSLCFILAQFRLPVAIGFLWNLVVIYDGRRGVDD